MPVSDSPTMLRLPIPRLLSRRERRVCARLQGDPRRAPCGVQLGAVRWLGRVSGSCYALVLVRTAVQGAVARALRFRTGEALGSRPRRTRRFGKRWHLCAGMLGPQPERESVVAYGSKAPGAQDHLIPARVETEGVRA